MKKIINIIIILSLIGVICFIYLILFSKEEVLFALNSKDMKVGINDTKKIDYYLSDENTLVTWTSGDNNIATVDEMGNVKGVSLGTTYVRGVITDRGEEKEINVIVLVYMGNEDKSLKDIIVPDGEILMPIDASFNIPFTYYPSDGYIASIDYNISDQNIIEIKNNKIASKNVGTATLEVLINNKLKKSIQVNVVDYEVQAQIIKVLKDINITSTDLRIEVNEKKKIDYQLVPEDAYVHTVKWESSNPQVASITNGELTGIVEGKTVISLIINDTVIKKIEVTVNIPAKDIIVDHYPKKVLKVGELIDIKAHVIPTNATNKKIDMKSSNTGILEVSGTNVIAKNAGKVTLTLSIANGVTKSFTFNVLPSKGVVAGDNIWGYTSVNSKVPVRANEAFFKKLASEKKGTLNGSIYTYNNCTYEINYNILSCKGTETLMRIYYPENTDLSTANTITFLGGTGEKDFRGYFGAISQDRSMIKTSGIVILVTHDDYNSYRAEKVINATNFVKAIVGQKTGVKNAVAGYSLGGPTAFEAFNNANYNKLYLINTWGKRIEGFTNAKNKDIVVFSPNGDGMSSSTRSTLNTMRASGYKKVTVVSNNPAIINNYSDTFLIINPGNSMQQNHSYYNITNSGVYAYACD